MSSPIWIGRRVWMMTPAAKFSAMPRSANAATTDRRMAAVRTGCIWAPRNVRAMAKPMSKRK